MSVRFFLAATLAATSAFAATVTGVVTDATGAVVPGARVALRDVATGRETAVQSGPDGRYKIERARNGHVPARSSRAPASPKRRGRWSSRAPAQTVDAPMRLDVGTVTTDVNVTAARSAREIRQIPLHVETIAGEAVAQSNALSTGDALAGLVNITPVGNGPFGVRPRLRGLDSTRLLVLVDGERLNTARQATDRTGAEVSLLAPDTISRLEVVNGAGTVLYGSDALAGTINLITGDLAFSAAQTLALRRERVLQHERGRTSRLAGRRRVDAAVRRPRAGRGGSLRPYQRGQVRRRGYEPAVRVRRTRLAATRSTTRSGSTSTHFRIRSMRRTSAPTTRSRTRRPRAILSTPRSCGLLAPGHTLQARYQRTRMEDIGFADFAQPVLLQRDVTAVQQPRSRIGALRSAGANVRGWRVCRSPATSSGPNVC